MRQEIHRGTSTSGSRQRTCQVLLMAQTTQRQEQTPDTFPEESGPHAGKVDHMENEENRKLLRTLAKNGTP